MQLPLARSLLRLACHAYTTKNLKGGGAHVTMP